VMSAPEATMPPPIARVAHRLPGRVRLVVLSRRGDIAFFADAAERLRCLAGVTRVTGNPLTGSLLLEHDAATSGGLGAIAGAAQRAGILQVTDGADGDSSNSRSGVPSSPLDAVSAGFMGLGLYQIGRGQVVGNAAENFWNAYGAAVTLRQPLVSAVLVGLGLYQVANGQFLGPASSLLYYALSARHMAKTGDPEAAD
jgi:hypothetical protein